jgi:hypothetical protein
MGKRKHGGKKMQLLTKLSDIAAAIEAGECEQKEYAENDWESVERNSRGIDQYIFEYRRRPTMKVVEWTLGTAPKCGEVIEGTDVKERMITARFCNGLFLNGQMFTWYDLLNGESKLTYNGKPCGTEVEE